MYTKAIPVLASLWTIYIFGWSLPYKFSGHEHTQFIFGTIWEWMSGVLWTTVGQLFSNYGAILIGIAELIVSIILLVAIVFTFMKKSACKLYALWWAGAAVLMAGAVFFHLFTPLGIEVNDDGGSLFRAAVSILIIGLIFSIGYIIKKKK